MKLISWNVNGIRSAVQKGFLFWLERERPDICALQETKAWKDQLPKEIISPVGYESEWFSAKKKGYSSVACYIKKGLKIDRVEYGLGIEEFDTEGRTLSLHFGSNVFINCYFPNSQREHGRLGYKLAFNKAILDRCLKHVREGKSVVICGDFNVAHQEIDLKNPKENMENPGFLPQEREWMTIFVNAGFVDTFRHFYPDARDKYSWWSFRSGVREKNIGWRIDYFCVSEGLKPKLKNALIHPDVMGSDHCPVSLEVNLP